MNFLRAFARRFPDAPYLFAFFALALLYWWRVLFTDAALLPADFLRGFAPFGSKAPPLGDSAAPWNILQWDAMAQYFPWRFFAGKQIAAGNIPLWNPHQFSGTPFLANGQSAVFYPLSLPFYLFETARAFGISAFLHTLLAGFGTYFFARRQQIAPVAALFAAIAFAFGGFLTFWITLPTLANTASWLPLLLLLLERATEPFTARAEYSAKRDVVLFALALAACFLAGHPQVFLFIVIALLLRAVTLKPLSSALRVLSMGGIWALLLVASQLLPFLELMQNGHRAGAAASEAGWREVAMRALGIESFSSLFFPMPPPYSFDENKGYIGLLTALLALAGLALLVRVLRARRKTPATENAPLSTHVSPNTRAPMSIRAAMFCALLVAFALLYAMASPLAQMLYFGVPGFAQIGGLGRSLFLWNFGAAILAAFALHAFKNHARFSAMAMMAILLTTAELFAASWNVQPTAPQQSVYPSTQITAFLQRETRDGARILFLTPRELWLPSEGFRAPRTHPAGVLPPNGATVYGLNDINGYDSLSLKSYRAFVAAGEENGATSPPLNGNMVLLNNPKSKVLDALNVKFIVSQNALAAGVDEEVFRGEGAIVYRRRLLSAPQKSGSDFAAGWKNGVYQPTSFRLGAFLSLCALAACAALWRSGYRKKIGV